MSMCHWICEGIGIRTNDLYQYLNNQKCMDALRELGIDDIEETEPDEFDIDDYLLGEPYQNLGDFLCRLDDTHTLSYGDDGDGESFFYYTPSYPWSRRDNEPASIQEVHERIIDAVIQVCDLSRDEVEAMIDDDIYEYGCG